MRSLQRTRSPGCHGTLIWVDGWAAGRECRCDARWGAPLGSLDRPLTWGLPRHGASENAPGSSKGPAIIVATAATTGAAGLSPIPGFRAQAGACDPAGIGNRAGPGLIRARMSVAS